MKRKIAVEESLGNLRNYLSRQGYDVSVLAGNEQNLDVYDAVVISGQDKNVMGITDTLTKVPVIDATGKSPIEIYNQIKESLE